MLHLSEDCDWEKEALKVRRMSRYHLLWPGVPVGGQAPAQVELRPRDGHRDPG